jgi:ferric-dicitrate binding protein FerR (iron transport regulator)
MDRISLIYKVLSAGAEESEKKLLEDWRSQSKENEIEFSDIRLLWEASSDADSKTPVRYRLNEIKALAQTRFRKRKQHNRALVRLILFIGVLTLGFFFLRPQDKRQGNLVFHNSSLEQIIKTLEREYDTHIVIQDKKISTCTFTGVFYHRENVNDILQTLDQALNLKHKMASDGNYFLTGPGCLGI